MEYVGPKNCIDGHIIPVVPAHHHLCLRPGKSPCICWIIREVISNPNAQYLPPQTFSLVKETANDLLF